VTDTTHRADVEKFELVAIWLRDVPCDQVIQLTVYEQHPILLVRGDGDVFTDRWGTPVAFTTPSGAVLYRWSHPAGFFVQTCVLPDEYEPLVAS